MSKLEKLIQQYCPDGVEWKTFAEVFETITDYTAAGSFKNIADNVQYLKVPDYAMLIRTTDLKSNFTKGGFIYVSQSAFNYLWRVNMDKECIVMPNVGNCGEIYYVQPQDLPYEHCALAPNAILARSDTHNNRYLSYCLQVEDFQRQLNKITSPVGQSKFNKTELKKLVIPVPPLPVQEEIVRILDTFTELQAELQAELQKRKQQYNFYRDNLLNFKDINRGGQEIKWMKLKDVATQWYRGAGIKREEVGNEGMPCIRYGEIHTSYNIWFKDCISHTDETKQATKKYAEYGDILFAITSEDIPLVGNSVAYLGKEKIMVGGDIVVMKHNQDPRYMAYALSTSDAIKQKGKGKVKSKVVHTNVPSLQEIVIPIPQMEEQQRIADILDRFDTLTNDLTAGLPAEMEKRRQQYEFYRDKLLTFKRKEA